MTEPSTADKHWGRIAGNAQVFVRSRIEIGKLLTEVVRQQRPLSVSFDGNDSLFISQLRCVDPERGLLLADYSTNRHANTMMLAARSATFDCVHPRGTIVFIAHRPAAAIHEGEQLVRFDFPQELLLTQRRVHRRIPAIPPVPLQCIADASDARPFECKVVDISCSGLGAIVYDDTVDLQPGTILKGCRIAHPQGTVIEADIEVRHCSPIVLPDGRPARRTGCRFIGMQDDIDELIRVFVLNLESPGEDGEQAGG
jgi:c-di-GMP-binding flagellar brake protein YcgR